jgi:hypothetical protein
LAAARLGAAVIHLTTAQQEVLVSLAKLSESQNPKWYKTDLIMEQRVGDKRVNRKLYLKTTEDLLIKLWQMVPRLVERRELKSGFSWALTTTGTVVYRIQICGE